MTIDLIFFVILKKDFEETVVKTKYLEELKKGSTLNQIGRIARHRPITCTKEVRFTDDGYMKNIQESSLCFETQEIWKSITKFGLSKVP